jgi:hypothetical protein
MVRADPVVGGLPTHGWATSFQVGSDGVPTMGYGRLVALAEGDTYPVVSARRAFKELNTVPGPQADYGIASCVAPMPLPEPEPESTATPTAPDAPAPTAPPSAPSDDKTLPCVPGDGHPTQVRGAEFGLSAESVSGVETLVPAWLFDTAPAGVSNTSVTAVTAVDPAYTVDFVGDTGGDTSTGSPVPPDAAGGSAEPGDPSADPGYSVDPQQPVDPRAPRHVDILAYHADGTALTLSYWGGMCETHHASASETADEVLVVVTETRSDQQEVSCAAIGKEFKTTVPLDAPLGAREVVDAKSGQPVKGQ